MLQLWVPIVLLCVLAAIFVFWPLLRGRKILQQAYEENARRTALNVAIFKERQAELLADLREGRISDDEHKKLELELEKTLLEDAKHAALPKHSVVLSRSGFAVIALFGCVLAGSLFWYSERGAWSLLAQRDAMQFSEAEMAEARAAAEQGDMTALLEQLYAKLQAAPDNMEGWGLLARSAMNMERYELASEAYRNLIKGMEAQDANPAPVYGLLAQALYFGGGGRLTTEVNDTLNKALTLDPNENNALGLKAINAYQNQRYAEAIGHWEKILANNPEHPARSSIEAGISRAQANLGTNASITQDPARLVASNDITPDAQQAPVSSASISVAVDISPALRARLRGNETLFIFARAVDGPPMPLAASRHSVSELPVSIVLDDAQAMTPTMKLSSVDKVNVVARVSQSGQPIAQAGDFEGGVENVETTASESISITINREL